MNPLQRRLASLRRRLRLQIGWRGLCALASLVVGAAVLVGLADWFLELPSLIRALALVGVLAAGGVIVYRMLLSPLASRCDDLSLALQIEDRFPELNDALASTVQFLQEPEGQTPAGGSASLRKAAITRTLALTENCDFAKILDRRGLLWITGAALVAVLAAGHFVYHHRQFAETAFWRLADPFGRHTWTRIMLDEPPHLIAQGQPFVLRGQIAGIVPAAARLEVEGNLKSDVLVPIKADGTNTGTLVKLIDVTQHKGKFRFRLHANDAVYPSQPGQWHEVEVRPPPKFADSLWPQIELRHPAYTDLPSPRLETPGTKQIRAEIAGTHVTYRAAFDRPLAGAWIELRPNHPPVRGAALLAHLGQRQPLALAASLAMSHAVCGPIPAQFEDERTISIKFITWIDGTYLLHVHDKLGLAKELEADLRVPQDPLPIVQLQRPTTSMSVLPDAEVSFKMLVTDEIFAVRSVFLEYRKKNTENRWLDDGPARLALYDHKTMGKVLPRLLAGLAASPLAASPFAAPDWRLRPKSLEIATKWPLKNQFKEGEIVVLQVGADDFCNLFPDRPSGRSHEIELRIVGRAEIDRLVDDGLGKAQQELVRLQQLQEQALNLVKDIQNKRAKNKLSQKEVDDLIEAEQIQKQIQERLGNRQDEGIRDDLAKLQQMIKDNKLPPSEVQDHIRALKSELERLAQEDLQQIEPNLAEARKELASPAKPAPKQKGAPDKAQKQPEQSKGPLDKAQRLQEQTKQSLDELAKLLDPWASMHQVKGETRELLNKQKDLKREVEKIQDAKIGKDVNEVLKDEELKADLDRKAEAQKELGDRAQKLLDMMDKVQAKRREQGDKDGAKKVKDAAQIGKDAMLPAEMREVADEIKKKPENAMNRQGKNIKSIEKMLKALDERKEDDLDRLRKKQKNAAEVKENVDQIAKDQDRLQKKVRDANKIENPEERAKELKRLAQEQEKLKEEAQKNARELARLQEEQAAKALQRAAQEMERAVQKLEEGQNPEEDQQEALDRVEEAQAKIEQFEEELAREQLARIADRIKGLKERQDTALERSKDLHKKITAKKSWTKGLMETLSGDIASQQGLAGETRSLKEKIKEAKVFEHVFEKAAKAMDDAAQAMEKRKETAADRRARPLEDEEIADENHKAQDTQKLQSLASARLQRLLDALKNDPPDQAENDRKQGEQGGDGGQKARAGDGIPPLAQLKALRSEQLEVNERTKEFAKQNPDQQKLTEPQRRELADMVAEQARLHRLFEEMTAQNEKKGDMP
jgi:hypothetical protein